MRQRLLAIPRAAILALVVAALGACASPRSYVLLDPATLSADDAALAGRERIFVATTRARTEELGRFFDGQRSPTESFVRVDVTVPATHVAGALERPRRGKADPAKHLSARSVDVFDTGETFRRELGQDISANGGRAMVFIHGYNTKFDEAVYRVTQIAHDSGYDGSVVLFTWASAGRAIDYVYDQNSASAARDTLEETLRMLARSGARRIDIIAHSMGNWVTLEALRQLAIAGDRDLDGRLGDVVLASPDVDVDVFKTQMARYSKPDKPFFVLLSRDDRALEISQRIAGNRPRLGGYADEKEIAEYGVIAVNLTDVSSGNRLNHTKFADNPALVKLLGDRLREDASLGAGERDVETRLDGLARGVGQTITSAAEIVITTPFEVLKVAVGE